MSPGVVDNRTRHCTAVGVKMQLSTRRRLGAQYRTALVVMGLKVVK